VITGVHALPSAARRSWSGFSHPKKLDPKKLDPKIRRSWFEAKATWSGQVVVDPDSDGRVHIGPVWHPHRVTIMRRQF
jgi:hypothetical protein